MTFDFDGLDDDEILAGYTEWNRDDPEPGANRGRSYWLGWWNASVDHGVIPADAASQQLAREYLRSQRKAA